MKRRSGSSGVPATKSKRVERQLTSEETPRRRRKQLSLIVEMPLDILAVIFGLLSPRDLFSLYQVSPAFLQTLSEPSFTFVWRQSLLLENAPECPLYSNQIDWVKLLYGTTCLYCQRRVHRLDVYIRRRLCGSCRQAELVSTANIQPSDRAVLELIPFTSKDGRTPPSLKFYSRADIIRTGDKLRLLNDRVATGVSDAAQDVEDFVARRKLLVSDFLQRRAPLEEWQDSELGRIRDRNEAAFELRYAEVRLRFNSLGYSDDIVEYANFRMDPMVRSKARLTDNTWVRIRETFEPAMIARRQYLLDLATNTLRASRRDIVAGLYARYALTVTPAEWKYLPTVFNVCRLPPFIPLVEADADTIVTERDFEQCMLDLPQLITDAAEATRHRLRERAAAAQHPVHGTIGFIQGDLATVVFHCGRCHDLIFGLDYVAAHHCGSSAGLSQESVMLKLPFDQEFPYTFAFSAIGVDSLVQVLHAAGLDPITTTVSNLDQTDPAFRCIDLECAHNSGQHPERVFSWRAMVAHILQKHSAHVERDGQYVLCRILPLKHMHTYRRLQAQPKRIRPARSDAWSCTRCTAHLNAMIGDTQEVNTTHKGVVKHVSKMHGIVNPLDGVDLTIMRQWPYSFTTYM